MFHRRELLQVGCSSFLGLGLSGALSQQACAARDAGRAKSVVLIFLTGGGSHIDMFDPKPEASEVKGEFDPIPTTLPGVNFSGTLHGLAKRADKLAIVRSMAHGDNRHLSGSHNALTGSVQSFRGSSNEDKSLNRADWPSYGAAVSYLRPRADGLPSQITLPNPLIEGVLVWPGQHAGFLGAKHDPFIVNGDPEADTFKPEALSLIEGLSIRRLEDRRRLLDDLGRGQEALNASRQGRKYTDEQERAFSMLTSSKLTKALDISSESQQTRERYGKGHKYGQTLLLARKLVELEMPIIQCNMGRVQTWDTHVNHFPKLKEHLPHVDKGVSAFLDDLDERGLLDQTLVICVGEFGRTPTISPLAGQTVPGRHHWAQAYTAVFAGAGVRGGQVIGATDRIGGYPVTTPFHPNDMGATIYTALGIDPHATIPDRLDRPRHLNQGQVMDVLYTGAAS
jgi:hypothetical protein